MKKGKSSECRFGVALVGLLALVLVLLAQLRRLQLGHHLARHHQEVDLQHHRR